MTNHKDKFNKVKETMNDLEQEYETFSKNVTYNNRNSLKSKLNKHREAVTNFMTSINNIFLR